jgi:hypothetical protein
LVATKFKDLVLRQSSSAKTLHASTTTSTHIKRDLKSFYSSQSEVGKIDRSPQQLQHLFKLPASFEVRSAQTFNSFQSQPLPCVQITTFTSTTTVKSVSDNLLSRFTNISQNKFCRNLWFFLLCTASVATKWFFLSKFIKLAYTKLAIFTSVRIHQNCNFKKIHSIYIILSNIQSAHLAKLFLKFSFNKNLHPRNSKV